MDDASSREEEQLKQRVRDANAACSPEYKEELKSGGCFGDEEKLEAIRALVKAEDELAKFCFKRDVESEIKRMDSVIEEELKRVEELYKEREGPRYKCSVCDTNLFNELALVSKTDSDIRGSFFSVCCGLCLCPACFEDQGNWCRCPAFKTAEEKDRALKKLASQNVGLAMYELSKHYDNVEDPTQARRWLLKAANSGVAPAQQLFGTEYFDQDEDVCIKWLSKAADQGNIQAYCCLAEMAHLSSESISPKDAFKYCSIFVKFGKFSSFQPKYAYFKVATLYAMQYRTGKNHFELGLASPLNLSIYWAGKFQESGASNDRKPFSDILVFDAHNTWYPNSAEVELPGCSVLPLVKRLENGAMKCRTLFAYGEKRCTTCTLGKYKNSCIVCNNKDRKNLKVCSGCKVFHYCDVDCQKKHWYAGHKKECQKKHWIESFFPDL